MFVWSGASKVRLACPWAIKGFAASMLLVLGPRGPIPIFAMNSNFHFCWLGGSAPQWRPQQMNSTTRHIVFNHGVLSLGQAGGRLSGGSVWWTQPPWDGLF